MTVKELIEELKKYPQDAEVLYIGGEYVGDYRHIRKADYQKELTWGRDANTVVIS